MDFVMHKLLLTNYKFATYKHFDIDLILMLSDRGGLLGVKKFLQCSKQRYWGVKDYH